jgi:tetratricopeptide (TPR) repeat protein
MKKVLFFASLVILLGVCFQGCKSAEETGGNIHLQQGRYDRAIEQFKEAQAKYPKSYGPLVSLSASYYMKKDYKKSVDYLEKAIEMDKKGAEGKIKSYEGLLNTKYLKWQIYYNGAVEYSKDNPDKGIELAKKSLEVDDPAKVSQSYNLLANIMFNSLKIDEAVKFLMKAIEIDTKNLEAYMTLGHHYLSKGDTEHALKYFNEVLKIDSTQIKVYELIGQAHLLKKAYAEAMKALEKALSITGKNPTILYNLMLAHYEAKEYDKAISYGKEVLGLPNVEPKVLTSTYNLMGQVYQKKGDYKAVIAVMKEAVEKGVNNCDSYSLIAHAYYKLGDVKTSNNWSKKWEECEKSPERKIEYRVTGSTSMVDVTYTNKDGGTSQANGVSIPWSYSFKASSGKFVYISAQNKSESGGITVTIYKDGSVFKSSKSSGAYCIAEASGTLP